MTQTKNKRKKDLKTPYPRMLKRLFQSFAAAGYTLPPLCHPVLKCISVNTCCGLLSCSIVLVLPLDHIPCQNIHHFYAVEAFEVFAVGRCVL